MKKVIVVVLFLALFPSVILAQSTSLGVKGGLSLGWFSGSNWNDYVNDAEEFYGITINESPHAAFVGAAYMDAMFSQHVGLIAELGYTTYGQDYDYTYNGVDYEGHYSLSALQIPLLLKFATQPVGGFYGMVGPSISLLLWDQEFEESGGGITVSDSQTPDNQAVLGILGGFGYGFAFDTGVLSIEARYGRNITDAFDDNPFNSNAFQMFVGYAFRVE